MSDARVTPPESSSSDSAWTGRRAANLFIVAFLAFQVAMPLTYYFGDRGYDERFSWRMFSTLRLQQCSMKVTEAAGQEPAREVAVRRDIQVAWVSLLERARTAVVENYLTRRCERQKVSTVTYTRQCNNTDGAPLPAEVLAMDCASRELRAQGENKP